MKPYGIKYLVSYHPAINGLIEEDAGVLYVLNMLTGNVFWFDNDNMEWNASIYPAEALIKDIGREYKEVDSFDNGYVNTDCIWEGIGWTSIVGRYLGEFDKNISLHEQKELQSIDDIII